MNPTGKKFISLFLVFSLIMLSANLYAKERQGAKLIVIKKDGGEIEGELITVKPTSLLLLNTEGKDVSVDVEDIKVIRILRKSRIVKGALYGLLAGGILALIGGISSIGVEGHGFFESFIDGIILFLLPVALKFLPPELTRDSEVRERFIMEAQSAAFLSHPNICTTHEIEEEEGRSFIAMEYIKG